VRCGLQEGTLYVGQTCSLSIAYGGINQWQMRLLAFQNLLYRQDLDERIPISM
jgi:hypothetical protein